MTRLRALLLAAAALVAGGLGIGVALNQSAQQLDPPMSAAEWCTAAARRANDIQRKEHFFVAVAQGAAIPKESGGRLLGDCADGTCTVAPDAAPQCAVTYNYECGPLVNGWRVCEIFSHPYFAKGWANEAQTNADFRWYGSLRDVVTACRAHFTGAECLTLLDADRKCWLLQDGSVCRYGHHLGTEDPCPYAQVQGRMPCTVYRGAGSEMGDATREWSEEEFDEL